MLHSVAETLAALLKMKFCFTLNSHTHKEQLLQIPTRTEVSLEKQEANKQWPLARCVEWRSVHSLQVDTPQCHVSQHCILLPLTEPDQGKAQDKPNVRTCYVQHVVVTISSVLKCNETGGLQVHRAPMIMKARW